ncbi:CPBP family intramembrane glutamic endopeptidase [Nocardiopsis chromatogenes]|uniref:CPBP family intramembrane glutamic endopeptidase n=1 Tax=Nocardiopsis chromatogenes TaxID=280239 RepID=UPI0003457222|nr:CPBP family intramembrane glutamic endopeptidase [Nocardiopsis chromatogenes]
MPTTPFTPLSRRAGALLAYLAPVPEATADPVRPRRLSPWAAYGLLAVAYLVVFGQSLFQQALVLAEGYVPEVRPPGPDELWPVAAMTWAEHAVRVVLALLMAVAAARATGLRLGEVFAPHGRNRKQSAAVFVCALVAYAASVSAVGAVRTATGAEGGFIMRDFGDVARMVAMMGPTQVTTGFTEELVAVGLVVLLLGAARRPAWEVGAVAVVAKLAYHAYYGWPVLALAPAALVMAWLYARTGRIWPIIAAHAVFNLGQSVKVLAVAALAPSMLG